MSNIRIGHMTLGIYQTNCYFVYRENSDKVLVFDPADHGEKIEEALGPSPVRESRAAGCFVPVT